MNSQPTVAYFIPSILQLMKEIRYSLNESCYICSTDASLSVLIQKKFCSKDSSFVKINLKTVSQLILPETRYLVVIHNHPSQKSFPSHADFASTTSLINLGELLHFKVLDHIIVTNTDYFSFAEAGILEDIRSRYA